jgi:ABC-type Zn2+ transport system substrate-binding protein/surface adhesin
MQILFLYVDAHKVYFLQSITFFYYKYIRKEQNVMGEEHNNNHGDKHDDKHDDHQHDDDHGQDGGNVRPEPPEIDKGKRYG